MGICSSFCDEKLAQHTFEEVGLFHNVGEVFNHRIPTLKVNHELLTGLIVLHRNVKSVTFTLD